MGKLWLPDPRMEMPELLEPGRKPIGPVGIDWAHHLTRGLRNFYLFNGSNLYKNLADKSLFKSETNNFDQSNFSVRYDRYGQHVYSSGISDQRINLQEDIALNPNQEFTLLGGFNYKSATQDHTFYQSGSAIAVNSSMLLWADTEGSTLRPGINAGASIFGDSNSIPVNSFVVWGVGTTLRDANSTQLWVNGLPSGTAGDCGNPNISGETQGSFFGQRPTGNRSMQGNCYFIAQWDRRLSDTEHYVFNKNPYQFLIPA